MNAPTPWYLLYDGCSADGRGEGRYCGRTETLAEAVAHLEEVKANPYSTGKVIMITDKEEIDMRWMR